MRAEDGCVLGSIREVPGVHLVLNEVHISLLELSERLCILTSLES